ncbi:unnamed protein product, partial [Staurois parvus]
LKHNTVQTNPNQPPTDNSNIQASVVRQAGSISIGLVGTGEQARIVGVTGQVQQVASSIVQRVRQRDGPRVTKPGIRTGSKQRRSEQEKSAKEQKQDAGQIQGPGQTQHQGRVCKSGH